MAENMFAGKVPLIKEEDKEEGFPAAGLADTFARRLGDNALKMGEFGLESLMAPVDYLRNIGGSPPALGGEQEQLTDVNLPDMNQLQAMATPGPTQENLARLEGRQAGLEEQFPFMTGLAEFGADFGTVQGLRNRPVRMFRDWRVAAKNKELRQQWEAQRGLATEAFQEIDPSARQLIGEWVKKTGKIGGRVAGRSAETAAEGALIAAFNDNDPMATAAVAAGVQAASSPALWAGRQFVEAMKDKRTLVITTAAGAIALTMIENIAPILEGDLEEEGNTAVDKLMWLGGLGAAIGVAGLGRVRGTLADAAPRFADAMTTIPRTKVLEWISYQQESPKQFEKDVRLAQQVAANPDSFNPAFVRRINRAMTTGNQTLKETMADLRENRVFKRQLDTEFYAEAKTRAREARRTPGNVLGVPEGQIDQALQNAEAVPQGQAMQNAQNANAQQTAQMILQQIQSAPIPDQVKQQIAQFIGDPAQMTQDKLMQLQQMLGSMGGQ